MIKCRPENLAVFHKALLAVKQKVLKEKEKEWSFSIDVNPYGFY